ncbi:MAG TPA: hypothetical protein VE969_10555 [Pyrinomonadaceae bacterium]|nr:hypothetical protein [Pyrinomonadaceae bacterium]
MPMTTDSPFADFGARGRRWLRRIFVEDWSLKLLALAITLVLWFLVTGRSAN